MIDRPSAARAATDLMDYACTMRHNREFSDEGFRAGLEILVMDLAAAIESEHDETEQQAPG